MNLNASELDVNQFSDTQWTSMVQIAWNVFIKNLDHI